MPGRLEGSGGCCAAERRRGMDTLADRLRRRSLQAQESVGDAGDLEHFGDVVDADDVGAGKDAGGDSGGGAPDALAGRSGFAMMRESGAKEAFARGADEERVAELCKRRKLGEEFVIL